MAASQEAGAAGDAAAGAGDRSGSRRGSRDRGRGGRRGSGRIRRCRRDVRPAARRRVDVATRRKFLRTLLRGAGFGAFLAGQDGGGGGPGLLADDRRIEFFPRLPGALLLYADVVRGRFGRRVVDLAGVEPGVGRLLAGLGSERSRRRRLAGLRNLPVVGLLSGLSAGYRRPEGGIVVRLAGDLLDIADVLLQAGGGRIVDQIAG